MHYDNRELAAPRFVEDYLTMVFFLDHKSLINYFLTHFLFFILSIGIQKVDVLEQNEDKKVLNINIIFKRSSICNLVENNLK